MTRRMLTFGILLASSLAIALATAPSAFAAEEAMPEAQAAEPGQAGCDTLDLAALIDVETPALQVFEVELEPPAPEWLVSPKLGYCKCGCGGRCRTSADCGGAACVAFISCC